MCGLFDSELYRLIESFIKYFGSIIEYPVKLVPDKKDICEPAKETKRGFVGYNIPH